jgi:hypothetical protein
MQHLPEPVVLAIPSDDPKRFMVNDRTVVNVLREVWRQFARRQQPVPSETILGRLNIPRFFGDKLMALLVDTGYLIRASEPCDGFVPAKRSADIKLADIAELVDQVSYGQQGLDGTPLDVFIEELNDTPVEGTLEDSPEQNTENPNEAAPEDPADDSRIWPEREGDT